MAWFKRQSGELDTSGEKKVLTEGLWVKCEGCRQIIWKRDLEANLNVCPKCGKHFRIDARARLAQLVPGARDRRRTAAALIAIDFGIEVGLLDQAVAELSLHLIERTAQPEKLPHDAALERSKVASERNAV